MKNYRHIDDSERLKIEHSLNERKSIKKIAFELGRGVSTISREIRNRAVSSNKSAPYRIPNRCKHKDNCEKRYLCLDKPNCIKLCRQCKLCNRLCKEYEEELCQKLFSPPYVCNGCSEVLICVLGRKYYNHRPAHKDYREKLVESRRGVNISEDELSALDEFVSPLIKKGQSIHHIVANNANEFNISEKSLYRYVSGGLFEATNFYMPRVLRLKPRKQKTLEHKVDSGCRIGRNYNDYKNYLEQNPDVSVVEMDSVIGRVGGKVLLTLMLKSCDLMLAFIRDRNTAQSVIDVFNWLYGLIGVETFCAICQVMLTDNGSEFSNPAELEMDSNGFQRTRIFYCDPRASFQKPNVEVNHEFIRRILPKGRSFDNLTQDDINLVMSHINSYSRPKLNDKSPLNMFSYIYGQDVSEKLGLRIIPANEIILTPLLLKK